VNQTECTGVLVMLIGRAQHHTTTRPKMSRSLAMTGLHALEVLLFCLWKDGAQKEPCLECALVTHADSARL
jgi:hypothetical protein